MVNHILLYTVNTAVHSYGLGGGVGRADLARYMLCTSKTVASRLEPLITSGYVREFKVGNNRGHGFRYEYNLTPEGIEYLADNWEVVRDEFKAWQNMRIMEELEKIRKPEKTKKSKKARKQEAAGQKGLL